MAVKRHLSPGEVLGIIESVARRYPRAWHLAHSAADERHDFAILVSRDLFTTSGGTVGGNWRRAEIGDFSMDGLSIENPADGLYYFADYIPGAGGPNPSISYSGHPFQDASLLRDGAGHYAPQGFVNPFGVPGSYGPLRTVGDYGTPVDPPIDPPKPPTIKTRAQFAREFVVVNEFYAAPDGLQRVGGMVSGVDASVFKVLELFASGADVDLHAARNASAAVLNLRCDVQAMIQWGYDLAYTGKLEDVLRAIRASDEYRAKHGG